MYILGSVSQNKILMINSSVDPSISDFVKMNLVPSDTRKKHDFPVIPSFYAFNADESYQLITPSDLSTESDMHDARHRIANYNFGGI
jgi:hypothetical protein